MLRLRQDAFLFPNGKRKALTLSYDDGIKQDKRLIALMNHYQIRGTFNLNAGLMGDKDWLIQPGINVSHYKYSKDEISTVYASQEIAVHSMTHPDLAKVPKGMISYEISQCKKSLEEIVHIPVTGMAYPFGTYNNNVIEAAKSCGITYSRTVNNTHSFSLPENFMEWHPTCHHNETCLFELLEQFLQTSNPLFSPEPQLFYLWGHSYEFDAYDQWHSIEHFFRRCSGNDDIWYATNGEIYAYLQARDRLVYSSTGDYIYNPSFLPVWLMIDGKVYCIKSGQTVIIESS